MKELDICLRDLVAAVRAAYRPTLAHDAMIRAAITELTELDEATPTAAVPIRSEDRAPIVTQVVPRPAAPPRVSVATEHAILQILETPASDETIAAAFERKERALCKTFAALRPIEAYALRHRLLRETEGDTLASQFARLTVDRRGRLIAVLADARRREAIEYARGAR
jgi:hypothetical protein